MNWSENHDGKVFIVTVSILWPSTIDCMEKIRLHKRIAIMFHANNYNVRTFDAFIVDRRRIYFQLSLSLSKTSVFFRQNGNVFFFFFW